MNDQQTSPEKTLTSSDLSHFTGTENWYHQKPLSGRVTYTDGVKYVADNGGAGWLLTDIFACQHDSKVAQESFQVWKLTVADDRSAKLVCEDGNGGVIYTQEYNWTDFPLNEVTLWLTDDVLLLPSEY